MSSVRTSLAELYGQQEFDRLMTTCLRSIGRPRLFGGAVCGEVYDPPISQREPAQAVAIGEARSCALSRGAGNSEPGNMAASEQHIHSNADRTVHTALNVEETLTH
jgi:hypothetical protein